MITDIHTETKTHNPRQTHTNRHNCTPRSTSNVDTQAEVTPRHPETDMPRPRHNQHSQAHSDMQAHGVTQASTRDPARTCAALHEDEMHMHTPHTRAVCTVALTLTGYLGEGLRWNGMDTQREPHLGPCCSYCHLPSCLPVHPSTHPPHPSPACLCVHTRVQFLHMHTCM